MHDFSIPTAEQILFTHAAGAADGAVRCVCRGNVASARYPADRIHCFMDGSPHARRSGRSVLPRRCSGISACPDHGEPHHPGSIDGAGGQRDLSGARNPMYLGFALLLLALAMYLGKLSGLLLVPLFMAYLQHFQIRPEERALQAKFGALFVAYCRQVRRWL